MKNPDNTDKTSDTAKKESPPLLPCIRCGELTVDRLGDKPICRACYEVRSSCCPEFGPDDLTDID